MALLQISEPGQSPLPHEKDNATPKKLAAGIDLGTTNTLIASMVDGVAKVLDVDYSNSKNMLPSAVRYSKDGVDAIGSEALKYLPSDPENTLVSFKRFMGKSITDVLGNNNTDISDKYPYTFANIEQSVEQDAALNEVVTIKTQAGNITPVQASADLLQSLAQSAENILNGPLEGVVITVPAYFDDAQRQATKDAAKLAGLNVLRLINEPTTAAIAYGLNELNDSAVHYAEPQQDKLIAVYDLGGGTFDISILHLTKGVFEVLSTGGNASLGGDDFDRAIFQWAKKQLAQSDDLSPQETQQLLSAARKAKESLTSEDSFAFDFRGAALTLTQTVFNSLIDNLVKQTINACKKALDDAQVGITDIDEVILVGGSTRVPYVVQQVDAFFQKSCRHSLDPDQVVAIGAAIQADILVGNNRNQELLLLDVIPLSLGIETMGGLVETIIPRNTTIPSLRAQEFTTFKDGQTAISIHVVQGERDLVSDCRSLAKFELRGIPPMVAGAAKVQVTFQVDADGLLSVNAEELSTGVKAEVAVKPSYGLAEEQIAQMIKSSYTHAQQDKNYRMLVEKQVEAKSLIQALQSALREDSDLLSEEDVGVLEAAIEKLAEEVELENIEAISQGIELLSRASDEFAAKRMNKSIAKALQGKSVDELEHDSSVKSK